MRFLFLALASTAVAPLPSKQHGSEVKTGSATDSAAGNKRRLIVE